MRRSPPARGFTLIELLVVLSIIGLLLSLAVPRYFQGVEQAREAALRQDLAVMRDAIDKHHSDTGRYPSSLAELVTKRYLRKVPVDPFTESAESWQFTAPADRELGAIQDVASGADGSGRDGTPYASW